MTRKQTILLLGRSCRTVSGDRDVLDPGVVVLHDHVAGDCVPGAQLVEFGRGLHLVWHGHRAHEAGNILAIDVGHTRTLINRNDLALKVVALLRRYLDRHCSRRLVRALVASERQHGEQETGGKQIFRKWHSVSSCGFQIAGNKRNSKSGDLVTFAAGWPEPDQRNRTPNTRKPQPAATPNTRMNAIPVTWSVVVPLLQPWS